MNYFGRRKKFPKKRFKSFWWGTISTLSHLDMRTNCSSAGPELILMLSPHCIYNTQNTSTLIKYKHWTRGNINRRLHTYLSTQSKSWDSLQATRPPTTIGLSTQPILPTFYSKKSIFIWTILDKIQHFNLNHEIEVFGIEKLMTSIHPSVLVVAGVVKHKPPPHMW